MVSFGPGKKKKDVFLVLSQLWDKEKKIFFFFYLILFCNCVFLFVCLLIFICSCLLLSASVHICFFLSFFVLLTLKKLEQVYNPSKTSECYSSQDGMPVHHMVVLI